MTRTTPRTLALASAAALTLALSACATEEAPDAPASTTDDTASDDTAAEPRLSGLHLGAPGLLLGEQVGPLELHLARRDLDRPGPAGAGVDRPEPHPPSVGPSPSRARKPARDAPPTGPARACAGLRP